MKMIDNIRFWVSRQFSTGLFIILWIALFSSCATSKNTDSRIQADYTSDFNEINSLIDNLKADLNRQISILEDKVSNMKVENRTVFLSPPDSMGKQYPTKVSETNASREDKEHSEVVNMLSVDIHSLSVRIDSISNKVDSLINAKEKVIELSWWDLHKGKVYAGAILLLFAFVLIGKLKKGG